MSYILDALKKAEADRDPEARASLAIAQHDRRHNRWLIYAVVIALIANAAILLWLFLPEQESSSPRNSAQQASPTLRPEAALSPGVSGTVRAEPAPSAPAPRSSAAMASPESPPASSNTMPQSTTPPSSMAAESATGETIIGPGTTSTYANPEPTPVSSLPSAQRARFPTLEFSTHVYADDADLRAVVVNGTRLEQGDRLGNMRLEEITEDGAVFRFEGRLVSVSVLDAWN